MSYHTLVGSDPHPVRPGCTTRWYATVDIALSGGWWHRRLVDRNGNYASAPSARSPTEDDAKDDALKTLQGDWWE